LRWFTRLAESGPGTRRYFCTFFPVASSTSKYRTARGPFVLQVAQTVFTISSVIWSIGRSPRRRSRPLITTNDSVVQAA
jgi:hypothetical protein